MPLLIFMGHKEVKLSKYVKTMNIKNYGCR